MSNPVITFDKVYKSYPMYSAVTGGIKTFLFNAPRAIKEFRSSRFDALRDISFEIRHGETVGFVGNNGAGKSTTLGLMAGVLKPTAGNVTVNGTISPLLELGGGFHPDLSGRENILLNGVLLGLTRIEVGRKTDEIIEFSELLEFIDQPIRTYSSGMLARLGFSVMAHLEPDILLVDEVLAVGDMNFQRKCIDKMEEFKRSGVTIVLVSHSMDSISMICDRVIWIEGHRINMEGSCQDVVPAYVSAQEQRAQRQGR